MSAATWQTSSGISHQWRPGAYFPDSNFRTKLADPLPPIFNQEPCNPSVINYFETTTGSTHDKKSSNKLYANDRYDRAAGNWNVHHIKDISEKDGHRGWRPMLSMSNEESEMKTNYKGLPYDKGVDENFKWRSGGPNNFMLNDHDLDGPTKVGAGSSTNPNLKGQPYYIKDQALLRELDPYVSTTQKDFRFFDPQEKNGYAKKDQATIWVCDEHPKAWGHGPKINPLPKNEVPRERPPMRDSLVFKHKTHVPYWPKSAKPVPNTGLKSEHMDKFVSPSDVKNTDAIYCPVELPYTLHNITDGDLSLPMHYNTIYRHIGSEEQVLCD